VAGTRTEAEPSSLFAVDAGRCVVAILDRVVHNAHRIQLKGDSLRKQRTPELATA